MMSSAFMASAFMNFLMFILLLGLDLFFVRCWWSVAQTLPHMPDLL